MLDRPTVITCSALKREYRRSLVGNQQGVGFVFLKADPDLLRERLNERPSHFFQERLLESQLAILEEPTGGLVVDASRTPNQILEEIRAWIDQRHV